MDIRIDSHTLESAAERGASGEEIIDVINNRRPIPAKYGRLGKRKVFDFNQALPGRFYEQKKIQVFYGKWEITDGDSV